MLRIGVVGAGFMGRAHCQAYQQIPEVEEIHLLTLRHTVPQAKSLAAEYSKIVAIETSLDALFEAGIHALDICTPTPSHASLLRAAIAQQTPVLCEKPIDLDFRRARALVAEADSAGVPLMVAQVIRFWPEYIYLRDTIRSGRLGALMHLAMERYSPMPGWSDGDWFRNLEASGGALFDLHVHDIDFARDVLGLPRAISCCGRTRDHKAYTDVFTTLVFDAPYTVTAFASYEMPRSVPFRMKYRALFESGMLEYDIQQKPTLVEYDENVRSAIDLSSEVNGYRAECSYFARCVARREAPDEASGSSAAETIRLLHLVHDSAARQGSWIGVEPYATSLCDRESAAKSDRSQQ
ncbi:MAG: Gfo/Idh/MocA family oxidoreductase [Candidatus Hydrogenedentes bacterium]|nr:Gfo/Idh/MocA family oxidoreductase [Candidatus Hydrogenedentota bacterium]